MTSGVRVSSRVARIILAAAEALGADPEALRREVGLDGADLDAADGWIGLEQENALWDAAARATGTEAFGVRAAVLMERGAFGVLEYALRASPDLRSAVARLVRYNRLTHEVATFSLVEQGDEARLVHGFRGEPAGPSRQAAEFTLACAVLMTAALLGRDWRPRAVRFTHAPPADPTWHEAVLGVVRFDADANEMVFDRADLDAPLVEADPALASVLDRHAEMLLASLPPAGDLLQRVRAAIAETLRDGEPTLDRVADRLGASPRTLQRHLADHDTSFQELVEGLRRGLAERYLADRSVAIAEVAFLLGYSEPSAFHRAFKRWTGRTPGAWRREARLAG